MRTWLHRGLLAAVAALLAVAMVLLVWPKQLQPSALPMRFVGYVDDATDIGASERLARFEIKNESRFTVKVWPLAILDLKRDGNGHREDRRVTPVTIKPGAISAVAINVPADADWQAGFNVAYSWSDTATIAFSEWMDEHAEAKIATAP